MTNYDKEQTIAEWLRDYKAYKEGIKNLKILAYDIAEEGMGIEYDKDSVSPTNKLNSIVENKVIKLDKLHIEKRIKAMSNVLQAIDKSLDSLNDIEREVIKNRCINGLYYYEFCYKIGSSERTAKRIKKAALKKMSIVIFGKE
jgi:DNA-directed RNA polymerase specialized sigma24 family protein